MCSIGGWYCWGTERPRPNRLKGLLLASETRGTSATGLAYLEDNVIQVHKAPVRAAEFLLQNDIPWDRIVASPRGLLHARATTKGSEKNNENNHPVDGLGWVVVHNGHIMNDDALFAYYEQPRFAEVDTATIPLVLSRGASLEDSLRHLTILAGNVSLAAWPRDDPDTIVLARLGFNEVFLFFDERAAILYWCSAPEAGRVMPGTLIGASMMVTVGKMGENRLTILRPKREDCTSFRVTRSPFTPRRTCLQVAEVGAPSSAGNNVTPATPGAAAQATSRWRWEQEDPEMTGKPEPDSDAFFCAWLNRAEREQRLLDSKLSAHTIPTGYGRWVMTAPLNLLRGAASLPRLEFRPYKRTKRWWDKLLHSRPTLPYVGSELDDVLPLERYSITESTGPTSSTMRLGHLCPWCGIWESAVTWQNSRWACSWCRVVSHPYSPKEVSG